MPIAALIHWPGVQKKKADDPNNRARRGGSWKALKRLYAEGKCRSIGVSNYDVCHLEELREEELASQQAEAVLPHVNQVELHPFLAQRDLRLYCERHGIVVQGYSPFGSPTGKAELLGHETVREGAGAVGCSPAQFLLLWATRQGISVIPKSITEEHIQQNMATLALLDVQAEALEAQPQQKAFAALGGLDRGQHFCWDPSIIK